MWLLCTITCIIWTLCRYRSTVERASKHFRLNLHIQRLFIHYMDILSEEFFIIYRSRKKRKKTAIFCCQRTVCDIFLYTYYIFTEVYILYNYICILVYLSLRHFYKEFFILFLTDHIFNIVFTG